MIFLVNDFYLLFQKIKRILPWQLGKNNGYINEYEHDRNIFLYLRQRIIYCSVLAAAEHFPFGFKQCQGQVLFNSVNDSEFGAIELLV